MSVTSGLQSYNLVLRRPSWGLAGVVVIIALGLLLLVAGETEFNLVGFLVVMGASMLAGFRWTITQVLLQGDRHHGAPRNHGKAAARAVCLPSDHLTVTLVLISGA